MSIIDDQTDTTAETDADKPIADTKTLDDLTDETHVYYSSRITRESFHIRECGVVKLMRKNGTLRTEPYGNMKRRSLSVCKTCTKDYDQEFRGGGSKSLLERAIDAGKIKTLDEREDTLTRVSREQHADD